ncbi:membrane protein [Deltaproteobacteria bacterium]|nr:membrane protein [Deltaproteobacteria bacterium]
MSDGHAGAEASRAPLRLVAATLATAVTMLALDLTWIGKVGRPFYAALGPLQRAEPYLPAAAAFYGMYLAVVMTWAVRPAATSQAAAMRGGCLGFVCYATYELTNWAVIEGWPGALVPVDIAWGVFLTGISAGVGRRVLG